MKLFASQTSSLKSDSSLPWFYALKAPIRAKADPFRLTKLASISTIGNMSFAAGRSLSVSSQCQVLPSQSLRSEKKRATSVKSFAGTHAGTVSRPRPSSLYEVLQVKNDATVVEIKRAYRRLAKLYHPDSLGQSSSDGHDFIEIHNAYATLSDPSARSVYDLSLEIQRRQRSSITVENQSRFYQSRSWETDQCW